MFVKTEDLIVQLTRSLEPVKALPPPSRRLARWTVVSLSIAAAGVTALGARADIWFVIRQPAFAFLALMALGTAVSAAASALVLSVPGAERSAAQRSLPVLLGTVWALALTMMVIAGGAPMERELAPPVHAGCVIQIAGVAIIPGWALFSMLHRGAPVRVMWTAALAALAASAVGAAATQFICPIDDPAHHLFGHFVPMALLAMGIAAAVSPSLAKWRTSSV
jgi:hypothetical protein